MMALLNSGDGGGVGTFNSKSKLLWNNTMLMVVVQWSQRGMAEEQMLID